MNWHVAMRIRRTEWGWSLYEIEESVTGSDGLIASANNYAELEEMAKEIYASVQD